MKQDEKIMLREIKWACRMSALSDGVYSMSLVQLKIKEAKQVFAKIEYRGSSVAELK